MVCKHKNLIAKEPFFTGVEVGFENRVDKKDTLPDYFMYRPYICKECGKTVLVLHAVVE